jgi:non-canonical (house-cleaning) NTP pyrophosphatase
MEVWCVASRSAVKLRGVRAALPDCDVRGVLTESGVPEQPVGEKSGRLGAANRLADAKARWPPSEPPPAGWVAIESFVETDYDCAFVLVELADGRRGEALSGRAHFPFELFWCAWQASTVKSELGCNVTVGEMIGTGIECLPVDDWQRDPEYGGVSRAVLIEDAVSRARADAH